MGMLQANLPLTINILDCREGQCNLNEYAGLWKAYVAERETVTECETLMYNVQSTGIYDMGLTLEELLKSKRDPIYYLQMAVTEQCGPTSIKTFNANPNFEKTLNFHYYTDCHPNVASFLQIEKMFVKDGRVVAAAVRQPLCHDYYYEKQQNQKYLAGVKTLWVKYYPNVQPLTDPQIAGLLKVAAV